jgi:hypothetical protein
MPNNPSQSASKIAVDLLSDSQITIQEILKHNIKVIINISEQQWLTGKIPRILMARCGFSATCCVRPDAIIFASNSPAKRSTKSDVMNIDRVQILLNQKKR